MICVQRNHKFFLKNEYIKKRNAAEMKMLNNDNNIMDGSLSNAFCHDFTT